MQETDRTTIVPPLSHRERERSDHVSFESELVGDERVLAFQADGLEQSAKDRYAKPLSVGAKASLHSARELIALAAGIPTFSPADLRHRRVSLLHLAGMPWTRIGEQVGHDDLVTTARTNTDVVADQRQLDSTESLP
jgi:integrase